MPILILGGRGQAPAAERSLTVTARTRRGVERTLQTWAITRQDPVERTLTVTARTLVPAELPPPPPEPQPGDPPTEYLSTGPLLSTSSTVSGLPGRVLTWEYSHTGQYEELTVTVDGRHGLATPTATLQAGATVQFTDGGSVPLDRLPTRTFQQMGQEPEVDVAANTTTFRFRNSFDHLLRGVRLPELIPWKLHPTPPAKGGDCSARLRQRQSVSALGHQVMRNYVDYFFSLDDNPLRDVAEWVEEERDFSTENMTPQGLWDQTYGLLGMVLHVVPFGKGFRLVGRWPQPVWEKPSSAPSPMWTLGRTDRREMLHTPTRITVRGAPFVTELTYGKLMEWLGDDPAREEISRALGRDSEWFEEPTSADSGVVRRGFLKSRGQLVAQVEFTTGDVTARETVDGKEVIQPFYGVMLGYKRTETTYDPECADRPILQRTVTHTWAYTPFTQTSTFLVTGPGVYSAAPAGDLTASEETTTTFSYSPQGWLSSRTTTSRRLASLQQQNAEDEPAKRGRLEAREYVTTVRTESWRPTAAGRWLYDPGTNSQILVPVYDKDSGDAIRTASLTRALPTPPEITDQAPPSYRCPDGCGRRVLDETGIVLATGDAGFAEETEISLPFLDPRRLDQVAKPVLASQWWRVVSTYSLAYPVGTPPGSPWGGENGFIREVRIQGSAAGVDSSVTVARLDPLLRPAATVSGLQADPKRGRSVMLAGKPGGARVRLVKGWNPNKGEADVEDAFVAFRTGFPPTPGDEIEWELNPVTGQREAKSAST